MRDLQQIDRANAQAIEASVPQLRAQGKWVITERAGLNFVGAYARDTAGQAHTLLEELRTAAAPGTVYELLEPAAVPGEHLAGHVREIASAEA
jgi:hypothetical protein